jgi:hypothetical protein
VGVDECDVGADGALPDVRFTVEHLVRLAFGHQGAHSGFGVERGDAGAAGTQPLGQGALRGKLHLQDAGEVLLREQFVLADVGGDDLADLPGLDQDAQALAVHSHIVGHHGQILHT